MWYCGARYVAIIYRYAIWFHPSPTPFDYHLTHVQGYITIGDMIQCVEGTTDEPTSNNLMTQHTRLSWLPQARRDEVVYVWPYKLRCFPMSEF